MPKYLCLQRNMPDGKSEKPSPEQMQGMYANFCSWQEKFKKNITDMGGKLSRGRLVAEETALDSPPIAIQELTGGYMIVSAESLDEAVGVVRECPGLVGSGSGCEVIEIQSP